MPQPLGIPCASNRSVSEMATDLPNVSDTIQGWFRPLELVFVKSVVENMVTKSSQQTYTISGVIQPFTNQELKLKPEGERKWKWKLLHTTPEVDLTPGENFNIRGTSYRVMGKADWSDYGTNVFELVEDYRG